MNIRFDEHGTLCVVEVDGEFLTCSVRAVSKELLRIRPPEDKVVDWYDGLELNRLRVRSEAAQIGWITRARVTQVEVDGAGLSVLLRPVDDRAASELWCILDEIATGEARLLKGATISPGDFPRVPARGIYTEDARVERLRRRRDCNLLL